jgi:hypothetical protein
MRQARQVSNPEKDTNAPIPVEAAKRRDFKSTLIAQSKSLLQILLESLFKDADLYLTNKIDLPKCIL